MVKLRKTSAKFDKPVHIVNESNLGISGTYDAGGSQDTVFTDTGETYTAENVAEGYLIHCLPPTSTFGTITIGGAGSPAADDITHSPLGADWFNNDVAGIPEVKRFEIDMLNYLFLSGQYKITAGANNKCFFKIYGTLNSAADITDDTYWTPLSEDILLNADGIIVAAGNTIGDMFVIDQPTPMLKYMLKIVAECSDGVLSNIFDIFIAKGK